MGNVKTIGGYFIGFVLFGVHVCVSFIIEVSFMRAHMLSDDIMYYYLCLLNLIDSFYSFCSE